MTTKQSELDQSKAEITAGQQQIESTRTQLNAQKQQITDGLSQVSAGEAQLQDGISALESAKAQLTELQIIFFPAPFQCSLYDMTQVGGLLPDAGHRIFDCIVGGEQLGYRGEFLPAVC